MTGGSKLQTPMSFLRIALVGGVIATSYGHAAFSQSSLIEGELCTASSNTAEADYCFTEAYESADRERNALIARIKESLDDKEVADLVKAESLWNQYRDATCMAEWRLYLGPFGGSVAELACLVAETRLRNSSLMRTYGARLRSAGQ